MSTAQNNSESAKRILVVDDNLMSRKVVLYRVEQLGYKAVTASSGTEALTLCSYQQPDLIFMDMVMNGMSGLDVLNTLKASDEFKGIPIVMISGVEETNTIDDCLNAGASDFLHKPVQADTLKEVIEDLIGGPHDELDDDEHIALPNLSDLAVFESAYTDQLTHDYGSEKTLGFVRRFKTHAPDLCKTMSSSSNDFERCRKAANALKGGARTLGLVRLAGACRMVEQSCVHGDQYETEAVTQLMGNYLQEALQALQSQTSQAQS